MGAETPVFSYEVTTRELAGLPDARGDSVKGMLASNYGVEVGAIRVILRYQVKACLLYTSPSPRDGLLSRMPSSA